LIHPLPGGGGEDEGSKKERGEGGSFASLLLQGGGRKRRGLSFSLQGKGKGVGRNEEGEGDYNCKGKGKKSFIPGWEKDLGGENTLQLKKKPPPDVGKKGIEKNREGAPKFSSLYQG